MPATCATCAAAVCYAAEPAASPAKRTTARRRPRRQVSWLTMGTMLCLASSTLAARLHPMPTRRIVPDAVAAPANVPSIEQTPPMANDAPPGVSVTDFTRELGLVRHNPLVARQQGGAQPTKDAAGGDDSSTTTSAPASKATKSSSQTSESAAAPTSTSSSDSTPFTLPIPYDGEPPFLAATVTDPCRSFMRTLVKDPVVRKCTPFSLLDKTSTQFFNIKKRITDLVRVLDTSCKADVTTCDDYFGKLATNMTSSTICGNDLKDNKNEEIQFAFHGLRAYRMLYSATCLIDPGSSQYCYAAATNNASVSSDVFLYNMAYGLQPTSNPPPSCSWCTNSVMSIFHSAAAQRSQDVSKVYEVTAGQINTVCGATFVNSSLPTAVNASPRLAPQWMTLVTLVVTLFIFFTAL